jgi:hypothetical protein
MKLAALAQNHAEANKRWVSQVIVPLNTKQPMMILTEKVMKQSPEVRLVAIHNHSKDGTWWFMNFELSNGYVTK